MASIVNDLWQAARACRRAPVFFAGAVLTLALGVGTNGAVFSILQAVLLQPLPYRSPDRVVMLWRSLNRPTNWRQGTTSTGIVAWHDQSSDVFENVAALRMWEGNLGAQLDLVLADRTERLRGGVVTPNFFDVLGVNAALGRVFTAADESTGARDLIVISHALWQRAFGGSPDVVGRAISLSPGRAAARPFTIVGVLSPEFRFTYPQETEVWALNPWSDVRASDGRAIEFNGAVARLRSGVTLEQAQSRMASVGVRPLPAGWEEQHRETTRLESVDTWVVGETRPSLLLLAAVALLLLVITCATVANMLFVRATERQRELAIRTALGADRVQIVRLLFGEGLLLSVSGAVVGTLVAVLMQPVLRALVPAAVPRADQIGTSIWTMAFAAGVALFTVMLVAVAPAWRSGRQDISSTLKRASSTTSADRSTTVWRRTLLGLQAGVAAVLLVGAALLLISFWRLNHVPLGFDGDRVLTIEMRLLGTRFRQPGAIAAFQDALTSRVASMPGVLEVGLTSAVPFRGVDFMMMLDRPEQPNRRYPANGRYVDAAFFSVMRMSLLGGRLFDSTDSLASPKVVVVSDAFARSMFGSENPIGRQLGWSAPLTIVGVVNDVRYVGRDKAPEPAVYFPRSQHSNELICLVARTALDAADIGPAISKAIYQLDPSVPTMHLTTIDRIVSESVANQRFLSVATAAFSTMALLLTLIGVAVLVARAVVERRREIAIRAALGAPARGLVFLLLRQGLIPIAIGTLAGLAAAFLGASALTRFLFDIAPREPIVYAGVALVVVIVAIPTCLLPARRVTSIAPAAVLRAE